MTSPKVSVVDYGSGNLLSVTRAFERCGAQVHLAHDAADLIDADRLVLPGVGAFGSGMQGLADRQMVDAIRRFAASGRPLLGICLGMQMLASHSEEFGATDGLGLIPGAVVPVPAMDVDGSAQKIPHIGWAEVSPPTPDRWHGTMFAQTAVGCSVYLVHSYRFEPDDETHRLADCWYGGHRISAAVQAGMVMGCQFHPEKSGESGLKLLAAFLAL